MKPIIINWYILEKLDYEEFNKLARHQVVICIRTENIIKGLG